MLRDNYEVFRDEFITYTQSMRVPLHSEMGDSQQFIGGGVTWRTLALRLSYHDTAGVYQGCMRGV